MSSTIKITCRAEDIGEILLNLAYNKENLCSVIIDIEDDKENFNYLCGSPKEIHEWKFKNKSSYKDITKNEELPKPIPLEIFKKAISSEDSLAKFLMALREVYLNSPAIKFGSDTWKKLIETKGNNIGWVATNIQRLSEELFKVLAKYTSTKEKYDYLSSRILLVYENNVSGNDFALFEELMLKNND